MIKVLIDTGNAPPKTGIGIFGQLLLAAMRSHQSGDVSVEEAGISSAARSLRPMRRLLYLARLSGLRRRGFRNADVVHFINQYAPPRREGVRYVVSIHDLDPMMLPEAHTQRYVLYFRKAVSLSLRRAHVVVTQSEAVRRELIEQFRIEPERVSVGGDGLSEEFMALADAAVPAVPDIPELLFVGQLSKKKNTAWMMRTVHEGVVSGAIPPVTLVLAGGEGHGFEEIRRELERSATYVRWVERPSLDAIVSLYSSCSAVVLPSLREGFGRPLLEAMYCDKPIIASRIPTSVEIAGSCGHFFGLGDADEFYQCVRDALGDTRRAERAAAAREALARYSWKNLSAVYSNIYRMAVCRS